MRLNPMLMEKLAGGEEFAAGRDLEEIALLYGDLSQKIIPSVFADQ